MDTAKLDRILHDAILGRAVLFLGSGASTEAKNALGEPLPVAPVLVTRMASDLGIANNDYSLQTIATHFKKKKGAHKLVELLKEELEVKSVSEGLSTLLALPWRRIYTTNYDNVVEYAMPKLATFSIGDDTRNVKKGSCIHLNGYIHKVDLTTLDRDLVLTDWSYAQSELFSSPWLSLFSGDVYASPSVLFAGFSMQDLDITRALIRQPAVASKCALITRESEDPIVVDALEAYGSVYPAGMRYLFARLKQAKKAPAEQLSSLLLDSFQDLSFAEDDSSGGSRSERMFHQFVYGRLDELKIVHPTPHDGDLVVNRPEVASACDSALAQGHCNLIVHGGLGAGKSIAALLAGRHLLSKDYRVFKATNRRHSLDELQQIASHAGEARVVVIFDNYHRFRSEIEYFSSIRRPGDFLILADRTQRHDLQDSFLERVLSAKYTEVSVDRLSFDELTQLDADLNFCGLWREYAGWRKGQRLRFAQDTLSSNMSRILLDVVRSRDIRQRIESEIDAVLADGDASKLFVAALVINSLQYDFWIRDWQNFFSIRNIQEIIATHRESIGNFVNLSASQWTTSSSHLSSELLRNVIGNETIVGILVDIFRRAEQMRGHDREMYLLMIDLMRYANVEQVINEENKAQALKEYYQRIRGIGDTANNSDYWLQYGMALSIHGYLGESDTLNEAEVAFTNAYRREEAKFDPNTRRIDNYHSRFQLQKAVVLTDSVEAARIFQDASQKLVRQVFDEEARHYPFKVGRLFTDIAVAHYDKWSADMQRRFRARCSEMVKYGEERLSQVSHKQISLMVNDVSALVDNLERRGVASISAEDAKP